MCQCTGNGTTLAMSPRMRGSRDLRVAGVWNSLFMIWATVPQERHLVNHVQLSRVVLKGRSRKATVQARRIMRRVTVCLVISLRAKVFTGKDSSLCTDSVVSSRAQP